ncbi:unnamed protein product, partial [Mesorhabditis spiculigera]
MGLACESVVAAPAPDFANYPYDTAFNLVVFNAFTDYWGINTFKAIKKLLANHTEFYQDATTQNVVVNTVNNWNDIDLDEHAAFTSKDYNVAAIRTQRYSCFSYNGFYQSLTKMIIDKKLQKTTINVVSQNPPRWEESDDYRELIYRANAHQINFIMVEDSIFTRCDYFNTTLAAAGIWPLTRHTQGHMALVRYDESDDTTLLENLFRLGTGYELVSQAASEDCGMKNFTLDLDSLGSLTVLTVVQTGEPTKSLTDLSVNITGPALISTSKSFYGDLQFLEVESINHSMDVDVQYNNMGTKTCVVKTYVKSPERVFATFIEDSSLDSGTPVLSSNQLAFVALHKGRSDRLKTTPVNMNISTISSSDGTKVDLGTNGIRASNFEWLTTSPLKCDVAARWNWIQASFTIGRGNFIRSFPFLCYPAITPTPAPSSAFWDVGEEEEMESHIVHSEAADPTCLAKPEQLAFNNLFVFGVSNTESENFVLDPATLLNNLNINSTSKVILANWDRTTPALISNKMDVSNAPADFYQNYSIDADKRIDDAAETRLFATLLQELVTTIGTAEENAFLTLLIGDRLPPKDAFLEFKKTATFATLVNQGHRVFAFMRTSVVDGEKYNSRDTDPLNSLTATTNGHFITIDEGAYNVRDSSFGKLITWLNNNLLNSRLLLTSNTPTLGAISLPALTLSSNVSVFVTATAPVYKNGEYECSSMGLRIAENQAIGLTRMDGTNFWMGNGSILSGTYPVCYWTDCMVPLNIRIWTTAVPASLQFAGFGGPILTPNIDDGYTARLAVGFANPDQASVSIVQCNNQPGTLLGRQQDAVNQDASIKDGANCTNARFYPFFCETVLKDGCSPDFDGIYYAQFAVKTADGNAAHFTRPFVCRDFKNETAAPGCNQTDGDGNIYCSSNNPTGPYYRGRQGKVVDCLKNGYNIWRDDTYPCECSGASGESCENGSFLVITSAITAWQPLGKTPEKGLTLVYYYVDSSQTGGNSNNRTTAVSTNSTLNDFYKQLQLSNQQFRDILYSGKPVSLAYQDSLREGAQATFLAEAGDILAWSAPASYQLKIFSKLCTGDEVNTPAETNAFYKFDISEKYCVRAATKDLTSLVLLSSEAHGFKAGFVKTWNDDYINAVATTGTTHGPSLMVTLDRPYTFTNTDPTARNSKRQNCTSKTVTYSLKQLTSTGYSNILLNILDGDGNQMAQRFVPFAVTDQIDCGKGTFDSSTGGCICPPDQTGVDCSLPACENGKPGTWGTTCNCDGMRTDCTTPWNVLGDPTKTERWN